MQAQQLFNYLDTSPTPFHATQTIVTQLKSKGFIALDEKEAWQLEAGKNYYVTRNESSLVAFTYPSHDRVLEGFTMVGSHTDSPTLKLKPNFEISRAGVKQLSVETYGGVLLNPWFDRDLSIAGRVSYETKSGVLASSLINFEKPVAMIPSLAIHLDVEANKNRSINAQKHLPVVFSLADEKPFLEIIKERFSIPGEILAHELVLYDTQKSGFFSYDEKLFASARLDNLLSSFIALEALLTSDRSQASLIVCNDHEEVGSRSSHGAQSNFLESVLERIAGSREAFHRMMQSSLLISSDNAHAMHPNYMDIHDSEHAPIIGSGVVLKYNADQSYATNANGVAKLQQKANQLGIDTQAYVVRSDMRCGSTIGPITASKLGVETLDIGLPTWAMHSIRESAAMDDVNDLQALLVALFNG